MFYHSWLMPLLYLSNLLINYFSRSFQYSSLLFLVCSSIITLRCARLWPGRLKCAPVALLTTWFKISLGDQPGKTWVAAQKFQYIFAYNFIFLHSSKYIELFMLQNMCFSMFQVFFLSTLILFPSAIYGHAVQGLSLLDIPFFYLGGYGLRAARTLDLIKNVCFVSLPLVCY